MFAIDMIWQRCRCRYFLNNIWLLLFQKWTLSSAVPAGPTAGPLSQQPSELWEVHSNNFSLQTSMKLGSRHALGTSAGGQCHVNMRSGWDPIPLRALAEHPLHIWNAARRCSATSFRSLTWVGVWYSSLPMPTLQSWQRLWAWSEAGPASARLRTSPDMLGIPVHYHRSLPGHFLTQTVNRCCQHQSSNSASAFFSKHTLCLGHSQRCTWRDIIDA